jgi:hypothetical protein
MRQLNRSPNYTTRWEDIPIVKSGWIKNRLC